MAIKGWHILRVRNEVEADPVWFDHLPEGEREASARSTFESSFRRRICYYDSVRLCDGEVVVDEVTKGGAPVQAARDVLRKAGLGHLECTTAGPLERVDAARVHASDAATKHAARAALEAAGFEVDSFPASYLLALRAPR